jgi:hypothetical protein
MSDYNVDALFAAAASYAARGWKLVRLYGIKRNGKCACGSDGCNGNSVGKHPSGGAGWQNRATCDEGEIERWFWQPDGAETERCNIGVLLGEPSGIIDIEYDTDEGRMAVEQWGLDKVDTPAYASSKGVHRFFRWEPWMPRTAVLKIHGIEIRLGGSAGQSVLPPSTHYTGRKYEWLAGKSPEDVPPAPVPEHFKAEMLKAGQAKQTTGVIAKARDAVIRGGKAGVGDRHDHLLGLASDLADRARRFDQKEFNFIFQLVNCWNLCNCEPPKSESEIFSVCRSQFEFYRDRREAARLNSPYEQIGLEYDSETHSWGPGRWRLIIVHSRPIVYKLEIPSTLGADSQPWVVRIASEEWSKPDDVATAISDQTYGHVNVLSPNHVLWSATWRGSTSKDEFGRMIHTIALSAALREVADHEDAPCEYSTLARQAGLLVSYLDGFVAAETGDPDEDAKPHANGIPKWLRSESGEWALWLKWHDTWDAVERRSNATISMEDRTTLLEEIKRRDGRKKLPEGRPPKTVTPRSRYLLFDEKIIRCIREISGESE